MPRYRTPVLALGAGLALALSGCSAGLTSTSPAAGSSAYTPTNDASGSAPVLSRGSSTGSSAGGVAPSGGPVTGVSAPVSTLSGSSPRSSAAAPLAGADFNRPDFGSSNTVHLRFDVLSLNRQGQLLQLAVRISSLDPVTADSDDASSGHTWGVEGLSDTSRSDQLVPISGIGVAYSGTTLIDVAAKKRYLVAVDSNGTCLCTPDLYSTYSVGPGESLTLNATYAAPPATTTKLDVDVPGIGSFVDVPLS